MVCRALLFDARTSRHSGFASPAPFFLSLFLSAIFGLSSASPLLHPPLSLSLFLFLSCLPTPFPVPAEPTHPSLPEREEGKWRTRSEGPRAPFG